MTITDHNGNAIEVPAAFENFKAHLQTMQQNQLRTFKELVTILEGTGLRYFAASGTVIGALRHGGFIPWDDDIDITMPRKDYEIFAEKIFSGEIPLKAFEWKRNGDYRLAFMKVGLPDVAEIDHHPGTVDVFPLDVIPSGGLLRKLQWMLNVYFTQVVFARCGVLKGTKGLFYRLVGFVLPSDVRKIHTLQDRMTGFMGDWKPRCRVGFRFSQYLKREFRPVEEYGLSGGTDVAFENVTVKVPSQTDTYLKGFYTNWRELPPMEKRLPHHVDDDPWFYSQLAKK